MSGSLLEGIGLPGEVPWLYSCLLEFSLPFCLDFTLRVATVSWSGLYRAGLVLGQCSFSRIIQPAPVVPVKPPTAGTALLALCVLAAQAAPRLRQSSAE